MTPGQILVVDDDDAIRELLKEYITGIGYQVTAARDGEEALQHFSPGKFACVVTDLAMPGIDGLELLRRVRAQDKEVPFLIVTGYPAIDSAVNAMKEGAYDYITKPFHMEDLYLKIERAIHAHQTEVSLRKVKGLVLTLSLLVPALLVLGIILGLLWK